MNNNNKMYSNSLQSSPHVKMIVNNVVHGDPAFPVPGHLSYGQFLIDKLKQSSNTDAVALINGATGHKTTFKQILQDVVNIATGLKTLGVKRGDIVAFCSENRDEYIASAIGVICCGATITPINVQYTKDEVIHVMNISKPSIILCSEKALELHYDTFKSLPFIKKIIQYDGAGKYGATPYKSLLIPTKVEEFEVADVQGSSDAVYIIYSSGTTGLPKGVMLSHLNALYSAANFDVKAEKKDRTRFLTIVPWYHAYGLMSTLNYISVGKQLIYFSGFDPLKYLQAIQQYKIQVLLAVPPIVVFLAKFPAVEKFDMSSIEIVWCGAAPLSLETINQAMKRLPNCDGIYQAYGMTETSLAATQDIEDESVKQKVGSGGVPLAGTKVKVIDIETGKKLGPNKTGEICVKGPIVMRGYVGNEAATKEMFDDEGFMKTGDIGYYDEDGSFFIVDRIKELIKYKGNQVAPAAVESVVLQHSGVAECGVVGTPDELAGELPTAFVVLKAGAKLTEKELLDFTSSRLSSSQRLRGGIIFVNEVPKNPSGKILRRVLKQRLQQLKKSKL